MIPLFLISYGVSMGFLSLFLLTKGELYILISRGVHGKSKEWNQLKYQI